MYVLVVISLSTVWLLYRVFSQRRTIGHWERTCSTLRASLEYERQRARMAENEITFWRAKAVNAQGRQEYLEKTIKAERRNQHSLANSPQDNVHEHLDECL